LDHRIEKGRFSLLEKVLEKLYNELTMAFNAAGSNWKSRLEKRLYKIGEQITFIEGSADSGREIKGQITGVSDSGELLIIQQGETTARRLVTGEVSFA